MSEMSATIGAAVDAPGNSAVGRSLWGDALHRLLRDWVAVAAFVVILIYAMIAIFSPLVVGDFTHQHNYNRAKEAPSWEYWLGTDTYGRSVLTKTMLAAHTSMTIAFTANVIAVPLGMLLGAIAGYYGGFLDDVIVWLYTTMAAIPGLIRLIAIKFAFTGKVLFENTWFELDLGDMAGLCIALGVMTWIGTCRLVRAEVMKLRELDYVLAARATGRSSPTILLRHILPNVFHVGIIQFSLGFVGLIMAEVTLSYLGLGVQNMPSWGRMIASASTDLIAGRWWQLAAAVGATFFIVLAWNLFGDRLRDALDPRLRGV